jgi:hypothetical protein
MAGELCIWYKPFDESDYYRIDDRIKSKPKFDNNDISSLVKFDLLLSVPVDGDGNKVDPRNGDEIVITQDSTRNSIMYNRLAGKIFRREKTPNGLIASGNFTFDLSIEQRGFSLLPFEINETETQSLTTYLDLIFLTNTTDLLGGILSDGTIIPKYNLLSADVDVLPVQKIDIAQKQLEEIRQRINYDWQLISYSEPDGDSLKYINQVEIWQV